MNRRQLITALSGATLASAAPCRARAESWPTRPVTLIVNSGAGGISDNLARIYAEQMSAVLGQRMIVENRPGALGNIGNEAVARAAPDGYTLLLGSTLLIQNFVTTARAKFDPLTSFEPIGLLTTAPFVVAARSSLGVKTMQDLVTLAKERPDAISIGSGQLDVQVELFKKRAGIDLRYVPYRTSPQALTDTIAGHIDLVMGVLPTVMSQLQDKALTPIGVSSAKRSPALPLTPTYSEGGLANFVDDSWYGVLLPVGTPAEIVTRLQVETARAVRTPAFKDRLVAWGLEPPEDTSPGAFARVLTEDLARWRSIVRELKMSVD